MPVEIQLPTEGNVVEVRVSAKLTKEDYECFVPAIEKEIGKHDKIRILFTMHDFHGWDMSALWEDMKFDFKHWRDIERLAMIGDRKWEKGMAVFCKPFTTAKIRYFDVSQADEARTWIKE